MTIEDRLSAFEKLGNYIHAIDAVIFNDILEKVRNENPWFTEGSIRQAFEGLENYLDRSKLRSWVSKYDFGDSPAKKVALIMPGNIPLAGFHDLLAVLISGHVAVVKLSSKDRVLLTFLIQKLLTIEPRFAGFISIADRLKDFDAVIATGSDNSARYFHYYFGKYPHIIRKNRTSCAVLTGFEEPDEIERLARDVFTYFGLGCRNVSKLFLPAGYDPVILIANWKNYDWILDHHKYHNNYDYQKSILLVNRKPFYDSGFVILQESDKIVSPISVVYYEFYESAQGLTAKLNDASAKIQCIVGNGPDYIPFGKAQIPELWDYADRVDTLNFLANLH